MKVSELIEKLKAFRGDATIYVANYGDDDGMYEYEPENVGERDGNVIIEI